MLGITKCSGVWLIGACLVSAMLSACVNSPETAEYSLKLPPIFSDNMVLQQGQPNVIWGRTTPHAQVRVSYREVCGSCRADAKGDWKATLDLTQRPPGTPAPLFIEIGQPVGLKHQLDNVAIGTVWIVGVDPVHGIPLLQREGMQLAQADKLRFCNLSTGSSGRYAAPTSWFPCLRPNMQPESFRDGDLTLAYFSRVDSFAFYSANALSVKYGYVGIIQTANLSELGSWDAIADGTSPDWHELNTAHELSENDRRHFNTYQERRRNNAQIMGHAVDAPPAAPRLPLRVFQLRKWHDGPFKCAGACE